MATIRVTRELLEYALDLPEGVKLTAARTEQVGDTECFAFDTEGDAADLPAEGRFALHHEETDAGLSLVSAVPIE